MARCSLVLVSVSQTKLFAIPVVVALVFGLLTVGGGFVADDVAAIVGNPVVNGEVGAGQAFVRDFWGRNRIFAEPVDTYRPLTPLFFRGMASVFGLAPLPFRIASMWAHGLGVLASIFLLRRLRVPDPVALVASLFFAVHAGHAECSGSIVAMADVLAFACGATSTALALGECRPRSLLASLVMLMVACGLKESAFVFGLASLVGIALGSPVRKRFALAATALVVVGIVAFQLALPRAVDARYGTTLATDAHGFSRVLLGLAFIGRGIEVSFVPTGMAFRHSYAAFDLSFATLAPHVLVGFVGGCAMLAALAQALRDKVVPIAVLLLIAIGPLALNSSLLVVVPNEVPERTLYATFFGASVLVAYAVLRIERRALAVALGAAMVLASSAQRLVHQLPYRDGESLFLHAVSVEPRSAELRVAAGDVHRARGEIDEAAWDYSVASFVAGHRPGPLDYAKVEELEGLPVHARFLLAPELLGESERCRYVHGFLRVYQEHLPMVMEPALQLWSGRYPTCFSR